MQLKVWDQKHQVIYMSQPDTSLNFIYFFILEKLYSARILTRLESQFGLLCLLKKENYTSEKIFTIKIFPERVTQ